MKLDKLRALRQGHRHTVLKRFNEGNAEDSDFDTVSTILSAIRKRMDTIADLDEKILEVTEVEDFENEIETAEDFTLRVELSVKQLQTRCNSRPGRKDVDTAGVSTDDRTISGAAGSQMAHQPATENSTSQVNGIYSDPFVGSNTAVSNVSNNSSFHRLPKLSLPRFDGDILTWQVFWDSFKSSVHTNIHLTDVQKFSYLWSLLDSEAAATVAGFSLTNANYVRAVELLTERFGQEHKIKHASMKALLLFPSPINSVHSLRTFYDKMETHVRGLESLGQSEETYGALLIPVILDKLPSAIRENLARAHASTDWCFRDLRHAIRNEVTILEASLSTTGLHSESPISAAFLTNAKTNKYQTRYDQKGRSGQVKPTNKTCFYCKGQHFATNCDRITRVDERIQIVKRDRLCFNCLGKHKVSECQSSQRCKTCRRRHHTTLCRVNENQSTENTEASQNRMETNEMAQLHSSLTQMRGNVLLKTAVASIHGQKTSTYANILLDEGSQKSFITEELARKLKLEVTGTETVSISAFGDTTRCVRHLETATIELETLDGSLIPLHVKIVPEIAVPLQLHVKQAAGLRHRTGLRLAHPSTGNEHFDISLLIGSDYYWDIVGNHVVRGDGPTAVQSKLGYLLSGPLPNSHSAITDMNAMLLQCRVEEKHVDLHKIRDIESRGTECELEVNRTTDELEFYQDNSQLENKNRFTKLPWRYDRPELTTNENIEQMRTGSEWITNEKSWPVWSAESAASLYTQVENVNDDDTPETSSDRVGVSKVMDVSRYSSLQKLIRVTMHVLLFIQKCRRQRIQQSDSLYPTNKKAIDLWIKDVQAESFNSEKQFLNGCGKPATLVKQLRLFVDDMGVIRCGGRIQNCSLHECAKSPILLPKKHRFTDLVIADSHEKTMHSGPEQTITYIRQTFWIPSARQCVNHVLRRCVRCRIVQGKANSAPDPPPLPNDRVIVSEPFTTTGVDFAGPMYVKDKQTQKKMYICLFTCACVRAVHLELVPDMSLESFMLCFRRFINSKSTPKTVYSYNAPTFVSASRELPRQLGVDITWKFIPRAAPWYGGWWERLVGLTKSTLAKVLGKSFVSEDVLRTVLCEVEAVINDRPLMHTSSDIGDPEPLTPSHLLHGRKIKTADNHASSSIDDLDKQSANKLFSRKVSLINDFKKRWTTEYLTSLREFHRVSGKNIQCIKVGDVVHIQDNCPRLRWKLGLVTKLIKGKDGLVRAAELKTSTGLITNRPVVKLFPLEI